MIIANRMAAHRTITITTILEINESGVRFS